MTTEVEVSRQRNLGFEPVTSQKRLRVGYLSSENPANRWTWSGTHYFMFNSLSAHGLSVSHLGHSLVTRTTPLERVLGRLGIRSSVQSIQADPLEDSRRRVLALERELADSIFDVIFAPVASREIAFLETDVPIVYLSVTTYRLIRDYFQYWKLPEREARALEEFESRAISKARLLVYSSSWAAESAIADYGVPPHKVRVIPFGANLDSVPSAKVATQKQRGEVCRLLFVAKEWERKGGRIAFDCLVSLIKSGVDAELVVCGCTPPKGVQHEKLIVVGLLDKFKSRHRRYLDQLLTRSHFFILPTQADCTPIVLCEANAFGLPVISSRTGGIPSIIEQGENGLLLPLGAQGEEFAGAIAEIFLDESRYQAMVTSARQAYEQRLNWDSWGLSMQKELSLLARSA